MIKFHPKHLAIPFVFLMLSGLMGNKPLFAQETVELNSLSKFKPNSGTWHEAGWAMADIDAPKLNEFEKGSGLLVNQPTKKNNGQDLISIEEFGDIDLEMEIMVAPKSNSGVYLMGQYEVQILDSWGKTTARAGDMGGIYERWDDSKPEGEKGYQGYAPRQNVSRGPGIWQKLKVSFQAPKFNESGEKIENAKFLSVYLNGVLIHENLEVFGPTRGSLKPDDVPEGPIRIQGDHGAVAFRNIKITRYDTKSPVLSDLSYEIYEGYFDKEPDFAQLKATKYGSINDLEESINAATGQHLTRFKGLLSVEKSCNYSIRIQVPSGMVALKINNQKVIELSEGYRTAQMSLEKGNVPIEILSSKTNDWSETGIQLMIEGPGLRWHTLSKSNTLTIDTVDPILVDEKRTPILRSFIDLPDGVRITHGISVSGQEKVHYSYDLNKGQIVQIWRGEFLDATPMWNNRGNGVSKPLGAVIYVKNPEKNLIEKEFQSSSKFKPQGYRIKDGGVEFQFENLGLKFRDFISGRQDGKGFDRKLTAEGSTANKLFSIAESKEIKKVKEGLFLIVDEGYYIQIDPKSPSNPIIESHSESQQLLVSINQPLQYAILF